MRREVNHEADRLRLCALEDDWLRLVAERDNDRRMEKGLTRVSVALFAIAIALAVGPCLVLGGAL